jgi:hypothetical protein
MNPSTRRPLTLLFALTTTLPTIAAADGPGPHAPPREAFEACASARAGDPCTVTLHDHTLAGTCEEFPGGGGLACRPNEPPPPPREAVDACAGSKEGDACSVTFGGRTLAGACVTHGGTLACRPTDPPPPRDG